MQTKIRLISESKKTEDVFESYFPDQGTIYWKQ